MNKLIIRWAINAVAIYVATLLPGIHLESGDWLAFVWLALIFGLLNALVRPLLVLLTCPFILLTLGLGTLVLNTVMLYLTQWVAQLFDISFKLDSFGWAFLGALVISIVSVLLSIFFKDELKGKRKRRKIR